VSRFIHKSHNVSVLLYHFVCPTKYRRAVITEEVDAQLKEVCLGIQERYEIEFLEIGADKDHVHLLVQSVPTYSPTQIIRIVKSLTGRELFARLPWLKKQLWGSKFWSSGFFVNTVGRYGSEEVIRRYVQRQGRSPEYRQLHVGQLDLFEQANEDSSGPEPL
jgi:REP element-mobilizing transposase RayT